MDFSGRRYDVCLAASPEGRSSAAPNSVIWLLCHYPDTVETDERVEKAAQLQKELGIPIWLYGSSSARYPEATERLIKQKILRRGVASDAVVCSGDLPHPALSLDTVQEAHNVVAEARKKGVKTLICISNRLQLLQVKALLRHEPFAFVWMQTRLRDWRWWYVLGRILLIPLACIGIGRQFAPLVFIRWARARLEMWPF
jgi:hypothetical protein